MTALSASFRWCSCNPNATLLAAFERSVKMNNQSFITCETYPSVAVKVRSLFSKDAEGFTQVA